MKHLFIAICCFFSIAAMHAQSTKEMQESAKALLQKGDFENAIATLERAAKMEPQNIEVLKDLSFTYYLKRDFGRAIEVARPLVEKPDADEQAFQILGMSYKAIAEYKECAKMYKNGLKKFPNSGVLYNEYGELLGLDKNLDEAIQQWEKGISVDPNHSGNYYNAAMFYMRKNDLVRVMLYGELFLNLESYSTRAVEFKKILLSSYSNMLAGSILQQMLASKGITPFEKTILELLVKILPSVKDGIGVDNIIAIRTRFILQWFQGKQQAYPYRLFDHEQYLLREGLFEAYNQWLFGEAANPDTYQAWLNTHAKEDAAFKAFQQSRVFKVPPGQYYLSR